MGIGFQIPRQLAPHHCSSAACEQARVHSLYLPVPLWCTVGNTEIKCRSEVDDEALSAGGRFQSLEYIPLLYS